MEFDITQIDKKLLLQTLFDHSAPIGLGQAHYDHLKKLGDNVDGLSHTECDYILHEFNTSTEARGFEILDYHKGKPVKLTFFRNKRGRILVDSDRYDLRNGKYRFFEAMLNFFALDEILITKKGFGHYALSGLPEHLIRPKEQEMIFKNLIDNTIAKENQYGKFWAIDETKVSYKSPLLNI
jgi:hypothetical protein